MLLYSSIFIYIHLYSIYLWSGQLWCCGIELISYTAPIVQQHWRRGFRCRWWWHLWFWANFMSKQLSRIVKTRSCRFTQIYKWFISFKICSFMLFQKYHAISPVPQKEKKDSGESLAEVEKAHEVLGCECAFSCGSSSLRFDRFAHSATCMYLSL